MFERYTETARRAIFWSKQMAQQLGSPEIETEHLLLGLLRADQPLAARFLGSPWAVEDVWRDVRKHHPERESIPSPVDLPLSESSLHVLLAIPDEPSRSSTRIGCEHLLLALLRDKGCSAARLLQKKGVMLEVTADALALAPHDDSAPQRFTRDQAPEFQETRWMFDSTV
jgi:ATP-dependent Clp protease ATP-binding subunit ClpC